MLLPLFWARDRRSVAINGVWVAVEAVPAALQRFCAPCFFYNEGEPVYELSKLGSAFLMRYRNRNFALCSYHQVRDRDWADFHVLIREPDGRIIGVGPEGGAQAQLPLPEHENLADIVLFEYANERNERDLRGRFLQLDLTRVRDDVRAENVHRSFAIGYPTYAVNIDDPEDGNPANWAVPWVRLWLTDTARQILDHENRRPMIQDGRARQRQLPDEDGMSGAPVFFFGFEDGRVFLGFVGMVTAARNARYMVYPAGYIRQFLDQYIDDHP